MLRMPVATLRVWERRYGLTQPALTPNGQHPYSEVPEPTDEAMQSVLRKIITRTTKLLTRRRVLVEEEGSTYIANNDSDSDETRTLQAAAGRSVHLPHRFRSACQPEVADGTGRHAQGCGLQTAALRRHRRL